ncbi:MAG TPA: hypothetical protein VF862_13195, partial [Gemmatimonadales bacterium]
MPFDASRLDAVRAALAPCQADYRASAVMTAEEVRVLIATARDARPSDRVASFAASLGPLGSAHIDVSRLSALVEEDTPRLSGPALEAAAAAAEVLKEIAGPADLDAVELAPGGNLAEAVGRALGRAGRAFGAAHVVALARAGRFQRAEHEGWLQSYAFHRWNRRERLLAPPVVIVLSGADLRAGGLAEYLDGNVKIVLVVRDEVSAPAPLVRLVTPGVWLAQSHDGGELPQLARYQGPAVLAWVPEGSAAFTHDPAASPVLGARLQVRNNPPAPRKGLGGVSSAQLAEELRQLEAMAGIAA